MLWQGMQNVSLDVDTLLLTRVRIKQKAGAVCAETVDASDSLWTCVEIEDDVLPASPFRSTVSVNETSSISPQATAAG